MSQPDPLVGKTLADRFEILERIGEGGTGVVYKARQISVDRIVAIKVLGAHVSTDPSWVKRFHNEARAASKLDHPNTVRLIDFGQTKEGLLFIAMEFLNGRSLRQEIDRIQRLPANRVLRIVSQICASLAEAHNQSIIHRDIKPDNIYLAEMKGAGDYVKVLDFSVAKLNAPDAMQTRAGVVFGTPQYMSPEQVRGMTLDARSDIYAVGIVAYEMITGRPPFDHRVPTEVVMMHLRDQPPPLEGPPPLVNLVMRALDKDPRRRQQSAEEMEAQCGQAYAELFPGQTPGSGVPNNAFSAAAARSAPVAAPPPKLAPPPEAPPRPVVSAQPVEQKTVLAAEAPVIPQAVRAQPSSSPLMEQKTVIAMEVPRIGGYQAPPPAPPPPSSPSTRAPGDSKTMLGEEPELMSPPIGGAKAGQMGTMMLPDSAGVVAYARQAAEARRQALAGERPPGLSPLFWVAWAVLGIGAGLAMHFFIFRAAT